MINKEYLKQVSSLYGFELNSSQLDKLDIYASLLVKWNESVNLTSITQPDEIVLKHFLDSFLLLDNSLINSGATIIDVGTGAGFPSVPSLILKSDLQVTLLDSLNKRINFLKQLVLDTELEKQVNFVHARAEDAGKNPLYREKFDIATARAVAHLRELSEYCLPFVKVGGYFLALKGFDIEQELEESLAAITKLGGKVVCVKKYELPNNNKRAIVTIKKISQISTKYPRIPSKIKKEPLC
ncbi:MAG: 16S rRNA (guanine(527)-N(7))-methyltransferase RsmG [Oscillospiraceae bacterium]